jgi:hypothetical protein
MPGADFPARFRGPRGAADLLSGLPELHGPPVRIRYLPSLRARRGELISGGPRGQEVHAGSFVPKRTIVLDRALLGNPREHRRILIHEVFHFVWVRLGNPLRWSYEALLRSELRRRARGELGWSSQWRKERLGPGDAAARSRKWREYACESFCDTAAFCLAGIGRHREFTLAAEFRKARRSWLDRLRASRGFLI